MTERWLPIAGFPGYSVSDHGRVRNDETGYILKPFPCGKDLRYRRVDLYVNHVQNRRLVHRLVAKAFLPPDPAGIRIEVNHFDCDPTNNHWTNLEWVTRQENEMHKRFMEATA